MAPAPAEGSGPASPRIGLFGGTFDPPHRGHLSVAADVADALALDRLIWIPAGDPPHKSRPDLTPALVRLAMVRAAIAGDARFALSSLEVRRDGPSYTVDTLTTLRELHPDAELFWIMGADQFRTMARWREPERVLALCTAVVMDRDGVDASRALPPVAGAERARFVPVRRVDLSSTDLRARAAVGDDLRGDVADAVADIIEAEGLYRG